MIALTPQQRRQRTISLVTGGAAGIGVVTIWPARQRMLMEGIQAMERRANPSELAGAATFPPDAPFMTRAPVSLVSGALFRRPGVDLPAEER
jgi:hypothetical protein